MHTVDDKFLEHVCWVTGGRKCRRGDSSGRRFSKAPVVQTFVRCCRTTTLEDIYRHYDDLTAEEDSSHDVSHPTAPDYDGEVTGYAVQQTPSTAKEPSKAEHSGGGSGYTYGGSSHSSGGGGGYGYGGSGNGYSGHGLSSSGECPYTCCFDGYFYTQNNT